jgi:hypothetical protein
MDERTIVPILSNFRHFSMLLQFILNIEGQSCAIFDICLTSDLTPMNTPTSLAMGGSCLITVESVKYWIIISFFRFFRGFILMGIIYLLNISYN